MQVREKQNNLKIDSWIGKYELQSRVCKINKFGIFSQKWLYDLVSVILIVYIIFHLFSSGSFAQILLIVNRPWDLKATMIVGIVLLLVPVNWGMEGLKWHELLKHQIKISYNQSIQMVLRGVSINFITPWGAGDLIGRLYGLKDAKSRVFATGAIGINGLIQMIPTFIFGISSLLFLTYQFDIDLHTYLIITILFSGISFLVLLRLKLVQNLWHNFVMKNLYGFVNSCNEIDKSALFRAAGIGFARYLIYSGQFVLLFILLDVGLNILHIAFGVFWILLSKSIVPKFTELSDLMVRGTAAVFYFELFDVNENLVIGATLLIWFINVVIPGITGAFLIKKVRYNHD